MKRSHRRHKNPQLKEENKAPFFGKRTDTAVQTKPFFQKKGLTIGQPGDKYEQEADAMADSVVNNSNNTSGVQQKEISSIQRESLATPLEDEKLGTAEQRMEEDKLVQEKPEIQTMREKEEEETPGVQTMGEEKEEEMPVQEMHEEEELQMQEEEEEEPEMQMQEEEEEETPVQTKSEGSSATASAQVSNTIAQSKGKGKPLAPKMQAEMESKFGADFSGVNIHTDQQAVEINKNLHAQAFTHGKDVYFNSGKYNPETGSGKHLLAHELTHVVQQDKGLNRKIQRLTCRNQSGEQPGRRAQGERNPMDERSNLIIGMASAEGDSNSQKAINIVTAIICYYYNPYQGTVRNITYDPDLNSGLMTTRVGRGSNAKGDIEVNDQFIQGTNTRHFARRVLQVGHELRHIQQYRSGMTGNVNKNEREFLAFCENALADEFEGTGRMSRATRRALFDAALGYYYCLSTDKKQEYLQHKTRLLTRRSEINSRAGRGSTAAPTSCRTQ